MIDVGDEVLESISVPQWHRVKAKKGGFLLYDTGGCDQDLIIGVRKPSGTIYKRLVAGWFLDIGRG